MNIEFYVSRASNGWVVSHCASGRYDAQETFVALDMQAVKDHVLEILSTPPPIPQLAEVPNLDQFTQGPPAINPGITF